MYWKISCLFFMTILVGTIQIALDGAGHSVARRSVRKAASIGGSKIMECDIDYPGGVWVEHIITWKKQGIEVPIFIQFNGYNPYLEPSYVDRIHLVEQASIRISDVRISDEGWYECTVVFIDGVDETNPNGTWIYLSVNSPPVLGEVSPSFLIQKQGETVDMFCEAMATPEPTLSWTKDGKDLLPSKRIIVSGNRVQIKDLTRSDGGVYTCTFKNVVGTVKHIIKMVIEGDGWIASGNAYIMVPPKNTTVKEGSSVELPCQAEGYPNNITYRWFKNGVDVEGVPGLMGRADIYSDGSFVIKNVIKEDTGWYKCQPRNGMGPPPEARAYLNITFIPRVVNMPLKLYLPNTMLGRIECPIEANPPHTLVTWTKDDKPIDATSNPRIKVNKQGSLIFKHVTASDEGRYKCTPFSAMGRGASSNPMQVIVRDPPYFVVRPKPIYQRQPMQQVTMPCQAEGDPRPTITWRKSDDTFPVTQKTLQDGGNLTIVNLNKEDEGTYECVAKNIVTSVITTALLLVEISTPHAPYNVSVTTTQTEAHVSWLPAYDGGAPQHYVLWYRIKAHRPRGYKTKSGGRQEWQTLRVIPDEATSITVFDLTPETMYQFTVMSRNRLGDGLFSSLVSATTRGDRDLPEPTAHNEQGSSNNDGDDDTEAGTAPLSPRNVTVRQTNTPKGGLIITWLPPPNDSVPVLYYKIEYRTVGRWVPLTDKLSAEKTSFTWTTVSRGARYYFRVSAFSKTAASSKPSKEIRFDTGDPMKETVKISDGVVGGIVGGLLFLFVAIILAVIAVKIVNKRKQREKAARYGNVKYFGPKQVEANKNDERAFRTPSPPPPAPAAPTPGASCTAPQPWRRAGGTLAVSARARRGTRTDYADSLMAAHLSYMWLSNIITHSAAGTDTHLQYFFPL